MYILETTINIYPLATKKVSYLTSDLVRLIELDKKGSGKISEFRIVCAVYRLEC